MKNQKRMNANKSVLVIFILHSILTFSQNKNDVYFVLKDESSEYAINNIMFGEKIGFINLLNKKEYEYHQKKVKEAKDKGVYYFDPNSGRDNLDIKVSELTFEIISRKKIRMKECEIRKLNLVDYKWIINNSWKKIAKQACDFKDIYFLHEIEKDNFSRCNYCCTLINTASR